MSTLHIVWAPHAGLHLWRSEAGQPLPPAPLLAQLAPTARLVPLRLALPTGPREVPALLLAPLEALRLPVRLQQQPALLGELALGDDARAMLNVTWMLLRQLAAGQLLPGLVRRGPRWQARWRAVGWDVDALAHALPLACLAAQPGDTPLPPAEVVADMLDALTDAAARAALEKRAPPLSARRRQLAGRWVQALYDARPVIEADSAALQALADALLAWTPPSDAAPHPRLSLSLAPPPDDGPEAEWRLQIGLILPGAAGHLSAEAVWASGARQLQGAMLQALARAAAVFPPLEGLAGPHPTGLLLSPAAALRFLEGGAQALEAEADVATAMPPVSPLRTTLRTHVGLDGLLAFDWALALGDIEISPAELAMLAAQKAPLVRLRKKWLRVVPEAVAAAAEAVEGPGATALGLALSGSGALQLIADDELTALFSDAPPPVGTPSARFQGTLRPYQGQGLGWLDRLARLGLGACLADDMGLGKTVQVLAHLCAAPGRTLLVCPLSVLVSWQREAARFAPHLRVLLYHGPERTQQGDLSEAELVVTTYAVAMRDIEQLQAVAWARVILDEAQHIKNPDTATSKAIRSLSARHRIAMTGTPVENRLTELWALFDFLNPGLLASRAEFRARYAEPIEKHQDPLAADQLRRLTRPFLLRRCKTDPHILAELPDKIEVREVCPLSVEQAALYAAVLDDMRRQLQGIGADNEAAQRGVVLGTLTKLKQICNHPAQFLKEEGPLPGRSGKLERLEELVEGVLGLGEQMLIFSQFTEAAALICRHLEQRFRIAPLYLHGGLDRPARQVLIDQFQAGEAPIFVLSLKAAGTGLTLTAASHVVHFDRWWNPAVEDQATDRAWRMGQQRGVQVRKLVCVGTIEERIDELIEAKRALAAEIINAGGPAGLSHAELMSLVRET